MAKRRRLTANQRFEIVRDRENGVSRPALAKRFGVTVRTIDYTIRSEKQRKQDGGIRTRQVSVTLTEDELAAFDDALRAHQIASRSAGMRALIRNANGFLAPDARLHDELYDARVALNRVGNNVSQIAKRMNEARKTGKAQGFDESDLGVMRALAGTVMTLGDQIHQVIEGRRQSLSMDVARTLRELADGT